MKIVLVLDDMQPQVCIKDGKRMTSMLVKVDDVWMVYCSEWRIGDGFKIVEMGEWMDTIELDSLLRECDEIIDRYLGGEDLYTKIKEVY